MSELLLRGVYTLTKAELDWYYQFGVSLKCSPTSGSASSRPIPPDERHEMMLAYNRRLTGPDRALQIACARAWSLKWEGETITLLPNPGNSASFGEDDFALAFARIENHFFVNAGWMEEGQLIRNAGRLKDIPGVIVQGRYDMPCPVKYAWMLHKAWPKASFQLVEGAGHSAMEPGIIDQLVRATERFAR